MACWIGLRSVSHDLGMLLGDMIYHACWVALLDSYFLISFIWSVYYFLFEKTDLYRGQRADQVWGLCVCVFDCRLFLVFVLVANIR